MGKGSENISVYQAINKAIYYLTRIMAYISGALFLGLALYLTVDVLSRKLGGPFTAVGDEVASHILAFGGTWALAYALADGSHVRIDVLVYSFPKVMQKTLQFFAYLLLAFFAAVLSYQMWSITYQSMKINALPSGSLLGLPLIYPQALASLGLTTLVIEAVMALSKMVVNFHTEKMSNKA